MLENTDTITSTPSGQQLSFDPEAFKAELLSTVQATLNSHSVNIRKAIKQPSTSLEEQSIATQLQQLKDELALKDKATKDLTRRAAISSYVNNTLNPEAATKLLDDVVSKYAEVDENGQVYVNKDGKVVDLKTFANEWLNTSGKWLVKGASVPAVTVSESNVKTKIKDKPTTLADIINNLG